MSFLDKFLKPKEPEALPALQEEKEKPVSYRRTPEEIRLEVCALIARFIPPDEIVEIVKQEYNYDLPKTRIAQYKASKQWKPLIESYRQRFVTEVTEVPLFHQKIRLERLEKMWEKSHATADGREKRKEQLAILKEAREETTKVERNTNILAVQFHGMDDSQLLEARNRVLERLKTLEVQDAEIKAERVRLPAEQAAQEVI